jgi:uncharacterized repeat protein (TIGR04076 family)
MKQWNKVKITVVKKFVAEDLIKDFVTDERKEQGFALCDAFEMGQEFILEKPNKPDGFCSWAFADINRDIIAMMGGANLPWISKEGTAIACCTDGLRPVVFKIERI